VIGYLRILLLFYRRHLRVQPLRELMAIVGVAAGVSLLFAVQVAHRSITGSFEQISQGVAGRATLELAARGPEGFDEHVAEEVERMGDVKAAAPIFEQPIVAVGPKGRRALTLVGANEQITALRGSLSLRFQHVGEASGRGLLVLTESSAHAIGARLGGDVTILVGGRTEHLALNGTVSSASLASAAGSPIAAAPLPVAQALGGLPNRITRILIEPRRGQAAALQLALDRRYGARLNARPLSTEATLLGNAAGPERQVTLLFGVISLVAGIILSYNALLLASDERRRFVVYLIEAGTPDSTIFSSLAFDALVLGLTGAVLGLLAGDLISLLAYRVVPGYITAAFAVGGQRIIGAQTILVALGGGIVAAFAAAAIPALVILRTSATVEPEAVGRSLSFMRRLRLSDLAIFAGGATLACISTAVAALQPQTTVVALVGLTSGLVICLPLIARQLLKLAHAVSQRSGDPSARLSLAELRGSPTRTVALLATGTVAAFLMVLIGGSVADVQSAVSRGATDLLSSASIWIKPGGAENVYTTQPFAYAHTQSELQRLKSVSSVLPWRDSFLDLSGRRVWVVGVPPQIATQIAPSQLIEGSPSVADRHLREGGWAAISQTIAREQHLHIGEAFELPTPEGALRLRLAATIANYGWLSGAVVMNANDHARMWSPTTATELSLSLKPGAPIDAVKREVDQALPAGSALTVQSDGERRSEVNAVLGSTLSRLNDTTIVVLIATVASVIALMMAAVCQRRERLSSLMSIGMSSLQFARLILYETGVVLLVGCVIGVAAGLTGQYLIDGWLHQTTGSPVTFSPAWQLGLRTIAIPLVISLVAALLAVLRTGGFQARAAFATE
jgi:putative ABC transport system permease protein